MLETDISKQVEMKEKMKKEFLRRTRNLFQINPCGKNLIKRINNWVVYLVRYSVPFLKGKRVGIRQMDQRTRKLMTMHNALHLRDDMERLYVSRKRKMRTRQYCVDASIQELEDFIQKKKERLMTATNNTTDNKK